MRKTAIGITIGAILGALDGASAWFSPEARPMMLAIVLASTFKGIVTGFLTGLIAEKRQSALLGVGGGLLIGLLLSAVAAMLQGDHFVEIVLPGMLVGAIAGFITQRYPERGRSTIGTGAVVMMVGIGAMAANGALAAQSDPDPLAIISPLVGRWKGTSEGQPGSGSVERSYERALAGRFIRVKNRSTYPAQPRNPKGEVHEDEGFFSVDRARKRIVFRQFHTEGFVNTYLSESDSSATRIVLTSEAIENIPSGWKARETYLVHGPDTFEEIFELAEPGKAFEVYSRARFERVK